MNLKTSREVKFDKGITYGSSNSHSINFGNLNNNYNNNFDYVEIDYSDSGDAENEIDYDDTELKSEAAPGVYKPGAAGNKQNEIGYYTDTGTGNRTGSASVGNISGSSFDTNDNASFTTIDGVVDNSYGEQARLAYTMNDFCANLMTLLDELKKYGSIDKDVFKMCTEGGLTFSEAVQQIMSYQLDATHWVDKEIEYSYVDENGNIVTKTGVFKVYEGVWVYDRRYCTSEEILDISNMENVFNVFDGNNVAGNEYGLGYYEAFLRMNATLIGNQIVTEAMISSAFNNYVKKDYNDVYNKFFFTKYGMTYDDYKENIASIEKYVNENYYQIQQYVKEAPYFEIAATEKFSEFTNSLEFLDYDTKKYDPIRNKYCLNNEELALYIYLDIYEGVGAAKEYINAIQDRINQRIAMQQAEGFADGILIQLSSLIQYDENGNAIYSEEIVNSMSSVIGSLLGKGFFDGIGSFVEGVGWVLNDIVLKPVNYVLDGKGLVLNDDLISVNSYEQMYIINLLTTSSYTYIEELATDIFNRNSEAAKEFISNIMTPDGKINLEYASSALTQEQYLKLQELNFRDTMCADALSHMYNLGSTIGNMAIPIAASVLVAKFFPEAALTFFGGNFSNIVSAGLLGVSAGGNAKHQAVVDGWDRFSASVYGILIGLSETCLERLGGIVGIGEGYNTGRLVIDTIVNWELEGVEEFLQEYVDAGVKSWLHNEEFDFTETTFNAFQSFIMGVACAMLMNPISSAAFNTVNVKMPNGEVLTIAECMEKYGGMSKEAYELIMSVSSPGVNINIDTNTSTSTSTTDASPTYDACLSRVTRGDVLSIAEYKALIKYLSSNEIRTLADSLVTYEQQKVLIDTVQEMLFNGDKISSDVYKAIFNSKFFAADSKFSETYLHDVIIKLGNDTSLAESFADLVTEIYNDAKLATNNPEMGQLHSFCDHRQAHVLQVAFLSAYSLDVIDSAVSVGNDGKIAGEIQYGTIMENDRRTMFIAGLLHDLGMSAGATLGNPYETNSNWRYKHPALNTFFEKVGGEYRVVSKLLDYADKIAKNVRNNHTSNSANIVLKYRDMISNLGVNPDVVAVLCYAHSKSNSGVVKLNHAADWMLCIQKIDSAITEYNRLNPGAEILFDKTAFTDVDTNINEIYDRIEGTEKTSGQKSLKYESFFAKKINFNQNLLSRMASMGLAIRVGDAYVSKAKIKLDKPISWVYNNKTYTANKAILTEAGVYMAYDSTAHLYFDNLFNNGETESNQYGAFIYLKQLDDGSFVPWNPPKRNQNGELVESIHVYNKDENGAFIIDSSDCLMTYTGESVRKIGDVEYQILDNGFYRVEHKDKETKVKTYKYYKYDDSFGSMIELTDEEVAQNNVSFAQPILSTGGQFLSGESNVDYDFFIRKIDNTTYLCSEYTIENITSFIYNTIDKGIAERVGEIASSAGLKHLVNIKFDGNMADYFEIVNGKIVKGKDKISSLLLKEVQSMSAKIDNKLIKFEINGYEIKKVG